MRVFGVDFSGGSEAGKKIWVCEGWLENATLQVRGCQPIAALPGGSATREIALNCLRDRVAESGAAVWGMDFPFGLPEPVMKRPTWVELATHFAHDYPTQEVFRARCRAEAEKIGKREIRRQTDDEAKTPFCPYNLRMYRQTYYGIRDVLAPLVISDRARVLPMQAPHPEKPMLIEICPASWLKAYIGSFPYKGRGEQARAGREKLLNILQSRLLIPENLFQHLLADREGDALDSVIACLSTAETVGRGFALGSEPRYRLEGAVYV